MDKLRILFATHGIPTSVDTDNASIFVSAEMKKFWQNNGIRHITSSPYHPATNGLAERAVQTFKLHLNVWTLDLFKPEYHGFYLITELHPKAPLEFLQQNY